MCPENFTPGNGCQSGADPWNPTIATCVGKGFNRIDTANYKSGQPRTLLKTGRTFITRLYVYLVINVLSSSKNILLTNEKRNFVLPESKCFLSCALKALD